jgi:hypothetical protein
MSNACAKIFWLSLLLAKSPPTNAQTAPTYEGHIRPLLAKYCLDCHREGEAAPFALESYEQARERATTMAQVTAARYMPPYKATPASLRFHNERRLTAAQIALFAAWAKQRAPRGRPIAASPAPDSIPKRFDHSWRMTEAATLPAEGKDIYRCFVIPSKLAQAKYIDAFRFEPGNPKVVHHALFFFDLSGAARKLDAESPEPGYPCFGSPGFLPTSSLGGWSPGNRELTMPANTAIRAPANADLVFQLHYRLTGKPEADQSRIQVRYATQAPKKKLLDIALTSKQIDIPAGALRYAVRDSFEIPVDVTLHQIIPHAHFLAQRMRAWATLPKQPRRILLAIDDWDFNWQDIYQLKTPLQLPAGTILEMEIRYNNTGRNIRNPNNPPRRVTWGLSTTDEMAGMHYNVTADDEARDLEELNSHLWGKMIRALGIGARPVRPR